MENDKILYAIKDNICFIKMIGLIQCTTVSGFDLFIKQILKDEAIKDILIDLCETEHIDSTNLGLIAEIAKFMIKKHNRKPTIISKYERVTVMLENMGFNRVFIIVKGLEDFTNELKEIPGVDQSELEKAKMILEAHKAIIELSDKNESIFKDVVKMLEEQLNTPSE